MNPLSRALLCGMALALLPAVAGCGKPRPPGQAAATRPTPCHASADCPPRWVCLAGECANPSPAALAEDPKSAVTPEKVKRQLEEIDHRREEQVDKVGHPE